MIKRESRLTNTSEFSEIGSKKLISEDKEERLFIMNSSKAIDAPVNDSMVTIEDHVIFRNTNATDCKI